MMFIIVLLAFGVSGILGADTTNKPCSTQRLAKIEGCCEMPKLIKNESYTSCGVKNAKSGVFEAFKKFKGQPGGEGGPACLLDCAMQNQGLLTSSGEADEKKIAESFEAAADSTWKPIVTKAISVCSEKIKSVDFSQVKQKKTQKVCNQRPALFLTCIRYELASNCPKSSMSADSKCIKKMAKLASCDPMKQNKSKSFPMFRAYMGRRKAKKDKKNTN